MVFYGFLMVFSMVFMVFYVFFYVFSMFFFYSFYGFYDFSIFFLQESVFLLVLQEVFYAFLKVSLFFFQEMPGYSRFCERCSTCFFSVFLFFFCVFLEVFWSFLLMDVLSPPLGLLRKSEAFSFSILVSLSTGKSKNAKRLRSLSSNENAQPCGTHPKTSNKTIHQKPFNLKFTRNINFQ